ncbi:MAG TPA: Ku protein [Thermoanaerobaculia bacterium]|nr:Ku protein [Thermoanaerobaculia bacterium]
MPDHDEDVEFGASAFRSFWTGTITFGLVTVPVALYSATRGRGTALRMIAPDGAPVHRRYVCSKDETPLEDDDIIRGYETDKGKFVTVTDDELEALEPRKSREIDLRRFVDRDTIDPVYFQRGYFLVPSAGTTKAYRLLAEVMEKKNYAGIATFVMRDKEYLVAIMADDGILRAETLRFEDEIRDPKSVGLPKKAKVTPAEVRKFEAQITRRSKKLDLRELTDGYEKRLEKLVAAKERKHADIVKVTEVEPKADEGGEVVDLLAVLSKSLGGSGGRKAPRKAPARRRAATAAKKK